MNGYGDEEKDEQVDAASESEGKPAREMRFTDVPFVMTRRAPVTAPLRAQDAPDFPGMYGDTGPLSDEPVQVAPHVADSIAPDVESPVESHEDGAEAASVEETDRSDTEQYAIQPRKARATSAELPPDSAIDAGAVDVERLPSVEPGADLSKPALHWGWKALVFFLTLGIYLAFLNRQVLYNSPPTGDQPFYLMVTISLIKDGDLNLANQFANHDEDIFYSGAPHPADFVGIPAPYPLPPHNGFAIARPSTEMYNFHWPGLSALLIPAWIIGGWFQLWWPATVVFMILVGTLTALNVFLFAYQLTGKKWIAFAVWFPISFTNPVMSYTYLIFTELTCGLLLIYALRRLAMGWGENGPFRRVLIGLCIALIPWVAWRCMPLSIGLGIYAVVQWWRYSRITRAQQDKVPSQLSIGNTQYLQPADIATTDTRSIMTGAIWLLVPVFILGALIVWHNIFLYGSLFPDNRTPERPFETKIFYWPWGGREDLTHFTTSIVGLLFDQKYGLFIYAPFYLLGILGLVFMFRSARKSDRRLLMWMGAVSVPYLVIICSFYYWNGLWCPPARFLTTFCPLMAAPLAMTLFAARNWAYRVLYGLLIVPGLLLMWPMLVDPRHMWPGNPVLDWIAGKDAVGQPPIYPFTLDVRGILPFVDPLGERTLVPTTAWVTALACAIFVLAFVLARRWQNEQRALGSKPLPFAMQGVAWVVGLVMVSGTWYYSNWEGLQHKTRLTEVGRWATVEGFNDSRGLAYLNGKVFMPDWENSRAAMFDTAAGTTTLLSIVDENGNNLLDHPGTFAAGPDGKLYVLNNGPDPANALLVLSPEGKFERKIALYQKSQISIGLAVDTDGKFYVSDMTGRRIKVYGPQGGDPIAQYPGERPEGFDNGTGVVLGSDGLIYETEISPKRVNVLSKEGAFIKAYTLKCSPWYVLEGGDYLDVSCREGGLYTINKSSGNIQSVDIDTTYPSQPTGMIYGPDNTIFIGDKNLLIEYKLTH